MAPCLRNSCTQKRIANASSSALGTTPATQMSGETFLLLYNEKTCIVSTLNNVPTCSRHSVMSVQALTDGRKRNRCSRHSTPRDINTSKLARSRETKHTAHISHRQETNKFDQPLNKKDVPTRVWCFSCAPPTALVALRFYTVQLLVIHHRVCHFQRQITSSQNLLLCAYNVF